MVSEHQQCADLVDSFYEGQQLATRPGSTLPNFRWSRYGSRVDGCKRGR
jgi:hypothetical protein